METTEEKYNKMFRELYDKTFPQIREEALKKYDKYCQIFLEWNTNKIDSKTAYERYMKLINGE